MLAKQQDKKSDPLPDIINPYLIVFSRPDAPKKPIEALVRADDQARIDTLALLWKLSLIDRLPYPPAISS
jgi:hypothetical protein